MKKHKTLIVCISIIFITMLIAFISTPKEPFLISYVEENSSNNLIAKNIEQPKNAITQNIQSTTLIEETNIVDENTNFLDPSVSEVFSGINTFENDDFSFKYINSWVKNTEKNDTTEIDFLISGRNALFSVVKEKVPQDFTLEDYTKSTKKTLEKKDNNKIIDIVEATYNNIKGSTIIYEVTNKDTGTTSVVNEFCIINNSHIYVFTYYTDSSKYENYLSEFYDLLNTLTFK